MQAPTIISVSRLLQSPNLAIPHYQRPYKWTTENVHQLFGDIKIQSKKSKYRLGTIVLHQEGDLLNIVDGQQRTITLLLAFRAILNSTIKLSKGLRKQLISATNFNPTFHSEISQTNIQQNYKTISRIVEASDFSAAHVRFLLNSCEVVTVILNDISEAFQFFDSQNSRGKELEPHDLLKAFHLREFSEKERPKMMETVKFWEDSETQELANLFALYLYRVRNWAKGNNARHFGRKDIKLFKGVTLHAVHSYPFMGSLRISHEFIDNYNGHFARNIDGAKMEFPFQLDQALINGRRFFDFVKHYKQRCSEPLDNIGTELQPLASKIIAVINGYKGRGRTGDRYIRSIFDCLIIYYLDRFGDTQISQAVERAFIWAYSLRLSKQVVQLASMDNHALGYGEPGTINLFKLLRDSTTPNDFLNHPIPQLIDSDRNPTKHLSELQGLFREMGYFDER